MTKTYTITVKTSAAGYDDSKQQKKVTEDEYNQILSILGLKEKELSLTPPPATFEQEDDITISEEDLPDYLKEDGTLDLEAMTEWLEDGCSWDDETGERDNALPFRVWVNKKWLVEYEVGQGECIEATWDHRIWGADIISIKVIETK